MFFLKSLIFSEGKKIFRTIAGIIGTVILIKYLISFNYSGNIKQDIKTMGDDAITAVISVLK